MPGKWQTFDGFLKYLKTRTCQTTERARASGTYLAFRYFKKDWWIFDVETYWLYDLETIFCIFFLGTNWDDSKNMPDKGQKRLALILLKTVDHPRKKKQKTTRSTPSTLYIDR